MRVVIVTVTILLLAGYQPAGSGVSAAQQTQAKSAAGAARFIDLDRLLAPIALYPDQLLAQILLCASDPARVAELGKWLAANKDVKAHSFRDAATVDGFEPSFVALALFPQVVNYMAERLDWTTQLGKAFALRTFVVNQDGVVHQKDLGPGTDAAARSITLYDPDGSWDIVE